MIYHLIPKHHWEEAKRTGSYAPDSLKKEGFIHFSTQEQVQGTAERFFPHQKDLFVLLVDEKKECLPPIKFEAAADARAGFFPHLYGKLDLSLIEDVISYSNFIQNKE